MIEISHDVLAHLLRTRLAQPPSSANEGNRRQIMQTEPFLRALEFNSPGECTACGWADCICSDLFASPPSDRFVRFTAPRLKLALSDLTADVQAMFNGLQRSETVLLSDRVVLKERFENQIVVANGLELMSFHNYKMALLKRDRRSHDYFVGKAYFKASAARDEEKIDSDCSSGSNLSGHSRQHLDQTKFYLILDLELCVMRNTLHSQEVKISPSITKTGLPNTSLFHQYLNHLDNRPLRDESTNEMKTIYMHVLPDEATMPTLDSDPPMTTRLYPFQKRSVAWMINREELPLENVPIEESDVAVLGLEKITDDLYGNWFMKTCAVNDFPMNIPFRNCRGGILAEEMGLGKTVEILALISARPRPPESMNAKPDAHLIPCKATLIITPSSILHQWIDEVKRHAPNLTILNYEGANNHDDEAAFLECDIVFTTYDVLRKEIHYARPDNERSRRYERKVERIFSPLTQFEFWRVCFDEAQMVERTVSNIAEMAARIPRVNAWAVTGTPIGNHSDPREDLYGLVVFLGIFPFCYKEWFKKLTEDAPSYIRFLKRIMIRHTKACVKQSAVKLPPQHSSVTLCNFTSIERHFYQELSSQFLAEYERQPAEPENRDNAMVRQWLLRFRHTCCHPQVGAQNQRLFGTDLMSLTDVLAVLTNQCTSTLFSLRRSQFDLQIRRGLMHEILKEWDQAVQIYESIEPQIAAAVLDIRAAMNKLSDPENRPKKRIKVNHDNEDDESDVDDEGDIIKETRMRLLAWLALHHQCLFCVASVYLELEKKDVSDQYFDRAEKVRREIMGPAEQSVQKSTRYLENMQNKTSIEKKLSSKEFIFGDSGLSGFAQFAVGDDLQNTIDWLNNQLQLIRRYRKRITDILKSDLHNEYSKDAEQQDLGHQYQTLYLQALKDRQYVLTGVLTALDERIEEAVTTTVRNDSRGEAIIAQEVTATNDEEQQLVEVPEPLMERNATPLSMIRTTLSRRVDEPALRKEEKEIIREEMEFLSEASSTQLRLLGLLQRESTYFSKIWNRRIEFYRALQRLSDDVAIPQDVVSATDEIEECLKEERKSERRINRESGRLRYLNYLERSLSKEDSECGICQSRLSTAETIALTDCGHAYCETCIMAWIKKHPRCPICNAQVTPATLYRATQPMAEASTTLAARRTSDEPSEAAGIFSSYPYPLKHEMPVAKGSFGSKIMTIVSHILYLNGSDADFKCLLFCQWEIVLDLFASAFDVNNIAYARYTTGNKKKKSEELKLFKTEPSVKVLMLNARSQSAGLTLTVANHVFFVEPSLSQAIELQAAGRVHRLGQTKETWVHRYLVNETVEREIYKYVWKTDQRTDGKIGDTVEMSRTAKEDSLLSDGDIEILLLSGVIRSHD